MRSTAGFTLLELIIAMTVMALMSVALYGVITIGATSAGAGERKSEQSMRFRTATSVMLRQLRSAAAMYVKSEEEDEPVQYFLGEEDRIDFVTAAPQGPDAAGLAIVTYSFEDGVLFMSETPLYYAYGEKGLDEDAEAGSLTTPLLYDVESVRFEYQRSDYETDQWEDKWDASEEDQLPAGVRITIEPATPDGPRWVHEVPVFIGVLNEISGGEDFGDPPKTLASVRSAQGGDEETTEDTGDGVGKQKGAKRSAKRASKKGSSDDGSLDDDDDFDDDDLE